MSVDLEKYMKDLTDLVKGATQHSDQAVQQLQLAFNEANAAKDKTIEQLRKDLDANAEALRKAIKGMGSGHGISDSGYKGNFPSRQAAKIFGLAIMGHCLGNPNAVARLKDLDGECKELGLTTDINVIKAMGIAVEGSGGFFTIETFHDTIIRLVSMYGVFRQNTLVVPMGSDRDIWPVRTGGFTVYCPGEGKAPDKSDISAGQVAIQAKEWLTLTLISSQLMEDAAIALAELVSKEIALAFATKEDACGFMGDGTATYFGITGVFKHAKTTSQACASGDNTFAKACQWKYLTGAVGLLPSWALVDARYYFHRSVFWNHVVGQVDTNGQPIVKFAIGSGNAGVMTVPPAAGGNGQVFTPTLLGFPVSMSESLPTITDTGATKGVWAFGSLFMSWMLGDRRMLQVKQSTEFAFDTGQTAIRGSQRIGISPADASGMVVTTTAA